MEQSPTYRKDIDGLRAVAILGVLAFHAFPSLVPGGFYGVDVFFVISGFLITKIIATGLEKQSYSVAEFYARRIKRIFPALITVLITFFVLAVIALNASEVKQYGKHLLGASGFFSNLLLKSELGYFDVSSERKPLLHLWSLGIEEQFYLIWPLILMLTLRLKKSFFSVAVLFTALSFGLNLWQARSFASAGFYLPQNRIWELLIGGILATWRINTASIQTTLSANLKSILGLILIGMSFWLFTRDNPFLGIWAILPTLGTFFIIDAGSKAVFNRTLLSASPMTFIGKISYPLYLWHWPLLAFARILEFGNPSRAVIEGALVLSFFLAWLTFMFIEKPSRHLKNAVPLLCSLLGAVALIGGYTYLKDGAITPRLVESEQAIRSIQASTIAKKFISDCRGLGFSGKTGCKTDSREIASRMIVGDSQAGAFYPGLVDRSEGGERWTYLGVSGFKLAKGMPWERKEWQEVQRNGLDYLANSKEKLVLFVNAHRSTKAVAIEEDTGGKPHPPFLQAYSDTLDLIESSGKKAVIMISTPEIPGLPEDCVSPRPYRLSSDAVPACRISKADDEKDRTSFMVLIEELKKTHPHLLVYDPRPLFLHDGYYYESWDGKSYFGVTDHLSDWGSQMVADDLLSFLKANQL
jgi:peptidoglycan/LPS O-acetylase OafA/YrhL